MLGQIYQQFENQRIGARKWYDGLVRRVFGQKDIEKNPLRRAAFYVSLGISVVVALFPVYWMVAASLMPSGILYQLPPTVIPGPNQLSLTNYLSLVGSQSSIQFQQFVFNSFIVAATTATISIVVASLGGYSLARLEYPGKGIFTRGVLVVYMFSGILLVIPLFQLINLVGLTDTLRGLILSHLVFTLPLALYLLGNFFRGIDAEIEEAAMIDGYSRLEVIYKITLPMSKSALVAVFMFAFLLSWNEYLFATVFLRDTANFTIPIAIERINEQFAQVWGEIMAASVLASAPVFLMFLYLEKYMIEGLALE